MCRQISTLGLTFLLLAVCSQLASAQSITFSPSNPAGGQTVTATLSQPFNCDAYPQLSASTGASFTFKSILPSGIVNCGFIPVPQPLTSDASIVLGALSPGTYSVVWNFYQSQNPDPPIFQSSVTATIVVGPSPAVPLSDPDPVPALSIGSMWIFGSLCGAIGMCMLRRIRSARATAKTC